MPDRTIREGKRVRYEFAARRLPEIQPMFKRARQPGYLTTAEVARRLDIRPSTLQEAIRDGRLKPDWSITRRRRTDAYFLPTSLPKIRERFAHDIPAGLISAAEMARRLGVNYPAFSYRIRRGLIVPDHLQPNEAHPEAFFNPDRIEALRAQFPTRRMISMNRMAKRLGVHHQHLSSAVQDGLITPDRVVRVGGRSFTWFAANRLAELRGFFGQPPPNPQGPRAGQHGSDDIIISSGGGEDVTRHAHEQFHERGQFRHVIWQIVEELNRRHQFVTLRQADGRYDLRGVVSRAGGAISLSARTQLRLEPDGILVLIDPRFAADHAGRDEFAVYARNEAFAQHELAELRAWAAFAQGQGMWAPGVAGSDGLGQALRDWMNAEGRFFFDRKHQPVEPAAVALRQQLMRVFAEQFHALGMAAEAAHRELAAFAPGVQQHLRAERAQLVEQLLEHMQTARDSVLAEVGRRLAAARDYPAANFAAIFKQRPHAVGSPYLASLLRDFRLRLTGPRIQQWLLRQSLTPGDLRALERWALTEAFLRALAARHVDDPESLLLLLHDALPKSDSLKAETVLQGQATAVSFAGAAWLTVGGTRYRVWIEHGYAAVQRYSPADRLALAPPQRFELSQEFRPRDGLFTLTVAHEGEHANVLTLKVDRKAGKTLQVEWVEPIPVEGDDGDLLISSRGMPPTGTRPDASDQLVPWMFQQRQAPAE